MESAKQPSGVLRRKTHHSSYLIGEGTLMFLRTLLSAVVMALAASLSLLGDAIPYPSTGAVAPSPTFTASATGNLVAYFYDTNATFTEQLGLFVNGVQQGTWGLENHTSVKGLSQSFGPVIAGQNLVFALYVTDTDYTLFSTPAMNPDGLNHAYATSFSGLNQNSVVIPAGTYVGFEDSLLPFSDFNYHDETFVFTVVPSSPTPEPASFWLMWLGSLAAAILAYRKQSASE